MVNYLEGMKQYSDVAWFRLFDGETEQVWTYADYYRDIRRCAYQLEQRLGNLEGKHIGVLALSDYEYVVTLSAIVFSRGVAVPINENETEDNIAYAIKTTEVSAVVESDLFNKVNVDGVQIVSKEELFKAVESSDAEKDLKDFTDAEAENLCLIVLTSGTTSLSKAVALSVKNIFYMKRTTLPLAYLNGTENPIGIHAYINLPMYHLGGLVGWMAWPIHGMTMCMSKDPKHVLEDLQHHNIDYAVVTPSLLKLWITFIKKGKKERTGNVKHVVSGGALISPEEIRCYVENGVTFAQYYGMTETCGAVTISFDMDEHMASIGKPADEAEVFIQDGEICIKSWSNMLGYYNNPEETKECLRDGVIYSGDLGYIAEDGYVYITGRKKNLIILSGGENVSPEELEAKLYANKAIKECKVFEKNDRIAVEIYAPDQDQESIKQFVSDLNGSVPIYKRIYFVEFRDKEFEKTALGKIKR